MYLFINLNKICINHIIVFVHYKYSFVCVNTTHAVKVESASPAEDISFASLDFKRIRNINTNIYPFYISRSYTFSQVHLQLMCLCVSFFLHREHNLFEYICFLHWLDGLV